MFTGLNEIHFPDLPLAEPNVNTEDINGKQTMESIDITPNPRYTPVLSVLLNTQTFIR